jgi:arsenite-transporting ATPase
VLEAFHYYHTQHKGEKHSESHDRINVLKCQQTDRARETESHSVAFSSGKIARVRQCEISSVGASAMAGFDEAEDLHPSLRNVIEQDTLNWIFVGGKGGVGKTTTSCCLSVQLAKVRPNVLIVSTDPAHNLSDAFGQKFGREPMKVNGYDNLFCMEVDSSGDAEWEQHEAALAAQGIEPDGLQSGMGSIMKDLMTSVPGIDEAMAFAELMKMVQEMNYSTIVFDTAPTGHTLRLLSFPKTMESAIGKLLDLKNRFQGLLTNVTAMMGPGGADGVEQMIQKLEQLKGLIDQVHNQIKDPEKTTFVCVCIPEFLSIYETERLVQELSKSEIDTHNVVVNQVLFPDKDAEDLVEWHGKNKEKLPQEAKDLIGKTIARKRMQDRYISQIFELYEDFHVVLMPLLDNEVRGKDSLESFSKLLLCPDEP